MKPPEENLQKLLRAVVPEASRVMGRNYGQFTPPSWVRVLTEVLLDPTIREVVGEGLRAYGDAFANRVGDHAPAAAGALADEVAAGLGLFKSMAGAKACDELVTPFLSGEMTEAVRREAVALVRREIDAAVRAETRAEIRAELEPILRKQIRAELEMPIMDELRRTLYQTVREELRAKLIDPVREELNEELAQGLERVVKRSGRMEKLATKLVRAGKIDPRQAARALEAAARDAEIDPSDNVGAGREDDGRA